MRFMPARKDRQGVGWGTTRCMVRCWLQLIYYRYIWYTCWFIQRYNATAPSPTPESHILELYAIRGTSLQNVAQSKNLQTTRLNHGCSIHSATSGNKRNVRNCCVCPCLHGTVLSTGRQPVVSMPVVQSYSSRTEKYKLSLLCSQNYDPEIPLLLLCMLFVHCDAASSRATV